MAKRVADVFGGRSWRKRESGGFTVSPETRSMHVPSSIREKTTGWIHLRGMKNGGVRGAERISRGLRLCAGAGPEICT